MGMNQVVVAPTDVRQEPLLFLGDGTMRALMREHDWTTSPLGHPRDWPQALQLRLLALLAGCAEVSRQAPNNPVGHILLGGLFAQFDGLKAEINQALAEGPPHWAAMWQRDQSVMDLAAGARGKRLAKALAAN